MNSARITIKKAVITHPMIMPSLIANSFCTLGSTIPLADGLFALVVMVEVVLLVGTTPESKKFNKTIDLL